MKNHCVKLSKRPGVNGEPHEEHFSYSECPYPELSSSVVAEEENVSSSLYCFFLFLYFANYDLIKSKD